MLERVSSFRIAIARSKHDTHSPWCDGSHCRLIGEMVTKADILVRFGIRVRELRTEQGYSQEAFADACELDRTYVGGIERGERNLALRNIERIAHALGISLEELMQGL